MAAKPLIHHVCENQRCYFAGGIVVLSAVRRGRPGRSKALTGFWLDAAHVSPPTAGGRRRMEPRWRGEGGAKQAKKNSLQKKQLHAVSVFECCFLCFLSGFRDLVIQFSSAGPNVSSQSTSLCELVAFVAECQQSNGERLRFAASWCEKLVVVSAHVVDEG